MCIHKYDWLGKMNQKNRFLVLVVIILLIVSLFSITTNTVFADEEIEGSELILENWSIEPETAKAGEEIEIKGEVENIGDELGEHYVDFYVEDMDEWEDWERVSLEPGESETVTFTHSESELGTYEVKVEIADFGVEWISEFEIIPGEVRDVSIEPEEDQVVTAGEEIQFSAQAHDEADNLITDNLGDFEWENTDEEGLFDKTEAGEYEVRAIYGEESSRAVTVTVEPADLDELVLDVQEDKIIEAGETIDFSAEAYDGYGNLITSRDNEFEWYNADESGTFEETTAGEYEVYAEYEGMASESISVTVEPGPAYSISFISWPEDDWISAGEVAEYEVSIVDQFGNEQPHDLYRLALEVDGVIRATSTVSDGASTVNLRWTTTRTPGEYKIRIVEHPDEINEEYLESTEERNLSIYGELDRVEIEPSENQTIKAGEEIQFSAEAYDEDDNLITDNLEDFEWEGIDEEGIFNETEPGEYEVYAEYEGISSKVITVDVNFADVDRVEIEPIEAQTVDPDEEVQFYAEAYDEEDNLITDSSEDFEWENADDGTFSESESGEYEVFATYDGVESERVTITVEDEEEEDEDEDYLLPISAVIVIILIIGLVFYLRKGKSGKTSDEKRKKDEKKKGTKKSKKKKMKKKEETETEDKEDVPDELEELEDLEE